MAGLSSFFSMFSMFSKDIGIDLGTASVLVYIKGKGDILTKETHVLFHLINILYNYQNRPESCGSYTPLCIIT